MIVVRSFRLSDYAAVQELLADVLSEECYEETLKAFSRQLTLDSELVLTAEVEGTVAGVLIGTIDDRRGYGYYYRIAVAREHRGKGIAKALIRKMEQRFQLRKVSQIIVTADRHNEPILPLYRALGYMRTEPIDKLKIVNN
jgi:ribosomal protein S18 acetylase RimI-like enzyme